MGIEMERKVERIFDNKEQTRDVGLTLRKIINNQEMDEFKIKAPAVFQDHPHRGFDAVSYLIKGSMAHEDFCGHKGSISAGDSQWTSAGRGVVHCEMPVGNEEVHGLQLLINLAKKNKMLEPTYQILRDAQMPRKSENGVHVKVIAGEAMGIKSPIYARTPTSYLVFELDPGAKFSQPLPSDWNSLIYILSGSGRFGPDGGQLATAHQTLLLSKGDSIQFENANESSEQLHFILLAGQPINEPVVHQGNFAMNSQEEIDETFEDYKLGRNGFENALKWESDVAKLKRQK